MYIKRFAAFIFISILVLVSPLWSEKVVYESPFSWKSPEIMSQGGLIVSDYVGFDTLYQNPACFSEKDFDFKLSVSPMLIADIYHLADDFQPGENITNYILPMILKQIMESTEENPDLGYGNGLGGGAQLGMGLTGYGFGVGVFAQEEVYVPPVSDYLSLSGTSLTTVSLVAGYSLMIPIAEKLELSIGADVRPMYRVRIPVTINTVTGLIDGNDIDLDDFNALTGTALAFDAGVSAKFGMFNFGIALRDIGNTRFTYTSQILGDLVKGYFLGTDELTETDYVTPMSLDLGVTIAPEDNPVVRIFSPRVHLSYGYPLFFNIDKESIKGFTPGSFWTYLHLGGDIGLGEVIRLHSGINQGYLTAGMNIRAMILDISFSVYSEELGRATNEEYMQRQMGASLEFAIRI